MSSFAASFINFVEPWLIALADDPMLRAAQLLMVLLAVFVVFFVFFTTRDMLLRTHSFWFMFLSIILVAFLPVVGFLLYLLIRPSRTLAEKESDRMLTEIVDALKEPKARKQEARSK